MFLDQLFAVGDVSVVDIFEEEEGGPQPLNNNHLLSRVPVNSRQTHNANEPRGKRARGQRVVGCLIQEGELSPEEANIGGGFPRPQAKGERDHAHKLCYVQFCRSRKGKQQQALYDTVQ